MSQAMEDYFIAREDYEVGVEDGIEQGIEQKERDIVLNMYSKNYDFKSISDVCKLSIDKIKEIIDSSDNLNAKTR